MWIIRQKKIDSYYCRNGTEEPFFTAQPYVYGSGPIKNCVNFRLFFLDLFGLLLLPSSVYDARYFIHKKKKKRFTKATRLKEKVYIYKSCVLFKLI